MSTLSEWVEASPERRRLLAEESLILEVTEEIWGALARRGLQKQALAEELGCSKAHVTQLLNGARNMTLRTLADIALALEQDVNVTIRDRSEALMETTCFEVRPARRSASVTVVVTAANDVTAGDNTNTVDNAA